MLLADYQHRFKTAVIERDGHGVLTIRLTSWGGPLVWTAVPHRELAELFAAVAADRDNRVVIITGTGDQFVTMPDAGLNTLAGGGVGVLDWDHIIFEGNRLVNHHLDIGVPVIAAVNGPVAVHSELAVLADIVLCTPETWFADSAHFVGGLVPGDSMQIIWPMLLGPNRGRSFLLTGEHLGAEEAWRRGVVSEIVAGADLLARAGELAAGMARRNPLLLRNTRTVLTRPLKRAVAADLHLGLSLEALAAVSGREWSANPGDPDNLGDPADSADPVDPADPAEVAHR